MSRNSQATRNDNRGEIRKPTLNPKGLHFFLKDFEALANVNFGDASVYAFNEELPDYKQEDQFFQFARKKLNLRTVRQVETYPDQVELDLLRKRWFKQRSEFDDMVKKMYNEMLLHISDGSMNMIQSFRQDYEQCVARKDPQLLIRLIKKSHTQTGRVATREEKEAKKDRLKFHRQWDKYGKIHDIHQHNELFKMLLDDTKEVGVEWADDDLVDLYLKSVDNSLIEADLARIKAPTSTEMPTTLEEAMFWVIETNRTNLTIRNNRPTNKNNPTNKRKAEHVEDGMIPDRILNITNSSNDDRRNNKTSASVKPADKVDCLFCKKKHAGGAQECAYLKQLMKDHPEYVNDALKKKVTYPFKVNENSTSGGQKGGRSAYRGGKGSSRGRGRGRSGANSHSHDRAHLTKPSNNAPDDDLWEDFCKNQIQESGWVCEVTIFKSGKASLSQPKELNTYLYDNGATCNLFCNPDLLWNIEEVTPMLIAGIGNTVVYKRGMSLFGSAYVCEKLPFNIVAEQSVMKNDHVTFDSQTSPHYYVNGVQWKRLNNGLLTCDHSTAKAIVMARSSSLAHQPGSDNHYTEIYNMDAQSLPDKQYYSAPQRRRAEAVKRIHDILNHPSDEALGILLDRGSIHGCPYTSRDVRVMRKVFGTCVDCVKGKAVRATPGRVINQWFAHHPGERLCIDIFFLSIVSRKNVMLTIPFLIAVDDYTEYTHVAWLTARTTMAVFKALQEVIAFYSGQDWLVKEICGDRDTVFLPLKPLLREIKVALDIRGTDQKVPRADRQIRTLRDIFRTIRVSLFYKLPQFLYPHFLDDVARMWNTRPNARTVERTPREIVEGKKLFYDQHVKIPVGSVGEFFIPTGQRQTTSEDREQKKNEERTATGIVIGRNLDDTGTLEIYNIDSGSKVNRCRPKLIHRPSAALKARIRALTPTETREVVDEKVITTIDKLTTSAKRTSTHLDNSDPDPEHQDAEDRRGEHINIDDGHHDDTPQDNSAANTSTEEACEQFEEATAITRDNNLTTDSKMDTSIECESDNNNIENETDCPKDVSGVNTEKQKVTDDTSIPPCDNNRGGSISTDNDPVVDQQEETRPAVEDFATDYPTRRGVQKFSRKAPSSNQSLYPPPIEKPPTMISRAKRSTAGQPPSKFSYMTAAVEMHHNFQQYVYSAASNMTIRQAKDKYPMLYQQYFDAELNQFEKMGVGTPIMKMVENIKHTKILGMNGFFKEVFDLRNGVLKKLKFRLVPQGHLIDRTLYEPKETTSPTVSMETIFAVLNIAALEKRKGFTMDIPAAYLNSPLKEKHVVRFPLDLAKEYIRLFPKYKRYLQPNGTMLLVLHKALYGLVESSALWYNDCKAFLNSLGYITDPSDKGLFQKRAGKNAVCTLCLWVDDFLGWSTHYSLTYELKDAVIRKFGDARFDQSAILNYIGMTITQPDNDDGIVVKQTEHVKKIITEAGITKSSKTPINNKLMERKKNVKGVTVTLHLLSKNDTRLYLSLLMSIMYVAKRTRPDVLTPVCILSTRVQAPDEDDMKSLRTIIEYLNGTSETGLRFSPDKIELIYWIDASYNLHHDSRGHTGILVTVGNSGVPIYAKSQKQKLYARSSTEAELIATDEGVLHLLWMIQVFKALGYPQTPVTVMQDNMSTLRVCQTGHSKSGRLKHMAVRYNFIHGQQEAGNVTFKYVKSSDMLADVMSKPVDGSTFRRLISNIVSTRTSKE